MKFYIRLFTLLLLTSSPPIFSEPIGVDPDQLEEMVKNQDTLVIDVRTPEEWKETGTIPTSHVIMFFDENGEYDSQKWLAQ